MTRPVGFLVLSLVLLPLAPLRSQEPGSNVPPSVAPFRAGSTAIVVDAIVRDRKGRPVIDLALGDFEVYEDGVRQSIGALRLVAPDAPWMDDKGRGVWHTGISAERAAEAGPDRTKSEGEPTVPGQTVLAMLFQGMSVEGMVPSRTAALAFLETPERPDDFVGVFTADLSLVTIETFTNDRQRLRRAIDDATVGATGSGDYGRFGIGPGTPVTPGAESPGGPASMQGNILPQDLSRVAENVFREINQIYEGDTSIQALRALITALSRLPGRKTIVYFSEGLPLRNDASRERFDAMVEQANRANVSIYPVDAAGLRIYSQGVAAGRALNRASVGDLDAMANDPYSLAVGGSAMGMADHILRGGTTTHVFGRLAKETGGFVIENTNDLIGGFRRIDADRRFHYLLMYTPKNTDFNGEYRRIEVKVKRRGVNVRSRRGYAAVPDPPRP